MNANVPAPLPGSGLPSFLSRDGVRYGSDAKWTANSGWTDRDGLPLPPIMLVTGYATMLERWREEEGRNVVEYKIGHPLPDPEVLNAAIPISEWKIGLSGKPERPWKLLYAVYMIEPTKGLVFTWKNTTYGAQQAFEALVESVVVRQMLCGERAYPVVRLEKRPWQSATFGPQTRPHFEIVDWRVSGVAVQSAPTAIPAPAAMPTPAPKADVYAPVKTPVTAAASTPTEPPWEIPGTPAAAPAAPTSPASTILDRMRRPAKPITVAEMIADEIPESEWK